MERNEAYLPSSLDFCPDIQSWQISENRNFVESLHLISWNDEIIPNWSNNTLSFVTIIYRIFIENVGYIICVLVSLSLSLSMFDRSILVSRAFLKFTARRMRSRRAERWKLELKARSLHRVYSVKEKYIKLRVAMYARNLQFSANCIRFKLISIFCTQKGIDSDFLDSIVPFSAKIRRKERSSKLASRKTAKDSFILGRGEGGQEVLITSEARGGGEREKRKKWSVGIALSPSFLPFSEKLHLSPSCFASLTCGEKIVRHRDPSLVKMQSKRK